MKLYLIKRKSDKKFFISTNGLGELYFSNKPGMFLKTADGVAANLKRICSNYCEKRDKWNFWQKNWVDFDEEKLSFYEIVIMDVDVVSMTATPASEFIQIDAIKNAKASRFDKVA